jgi:hypothetical protein
MTYTLYSTCDTRVSPVHQSTGVLLDRVKNTPYPSLDPTKSVQSLQQGRKDWALVWSKQEPNSNRFCRFCICRKSAFQYHKLAMQGWNPAFQLQEKSPFQIIHNPKGIGLRSQQFYHVEISWLVYLAGWIQDQNGGLWLAAFYTLEPFSRVLRYSCRWLLLNNLLGLETKSYPRHFSSTFNFSLVSN